MHPRCQVEALFRKYDVDGNGMIDVDDLVTVSTGGMKQQDIQWRSGKMVLNFQGSKQAGTDPVEPVAVPEMPSGEARGWTGSSIRRNSGSPAHPMGYEFHHEDGAPVAGSPTTTPDQASVQKTDWSGD